METEPPKRALRTRAAKLISLRDLFIAWWPALVLVATGFAIAYQFVKPAPPDTVVMAAGPEEGAYYRYAERYREVLARNYIWLDIRTTSGSVENYDLLRRADSDVDIAFMQGGTGGSGQAPELLSLGSMYFEPLWVFHRVRGATESLSELAGARMAIGPEGSGTRKLALALLAANGIAAPVGRRSELTGTAAANALKRGSVDAVFLVGSHDSAAVLELLRDRSIGLLDFAQAEAYTRRFPYLSMLVLPRASIDLQQDMPARNVRLLATTANLIARDNLHPAIAGLLAAAATEVHNPPGLLQRKGDFPSVKDADFQVNPDAERYYKSGPPFLQRYLPFWAAIFTDRMIVLLVPVIALMIPLMRILPWLYNWRISSRIYRYYGQLRFLEDEVSRDASGAQQQRYLARLDEIEAQINRLTIPLAFNHQAYTLRQHIDLVRERIGRLAVSSPGAAQPLA